MSQHDYNIANGGGAAVRADINNALLAILSQNSGATAPTITKPFMPWYDTANGIIKIRNAADNAWLDYMNSSGQLIAPTATGLITALGGQIKFPASQNASADANTLDDYEEGTWTPTITASSGSGTYTNRIGNYVKVGKLVVVNFWIYGSGRGTLSGTATVSGLPFPITSAAESRPASYLRSNGISITGVVEGWGPAGTSYLSLEAASNGTSTPLASSSISTGSFEIGGSISYITDN